MNCQTRYQNDYFLLLLLLKLLFLLNNDFAYAISSGGVGICPLQISLVLASWPLPSKKCPDEKVNQQYNNHISVNPTFITIKLIIFSAYPRSTPCVYAIDFQAYYYARIYLPLTQHCLRSNFAGEETQAGHVHRPTSQLAIQPSFPCQGILARKISGVQSTRVHPATITAANTFFL